MNKLILSLALLVGFTVSTFAAGHTSSSFLKVQSVQVTNLVSVTNLLSTTVTTNTVNLIYTNLAGTKVTVATTTNSVWYAAGGYYTNLVYGDSFNVLADVPLIDPVIPLEPLGTNANASIYIRVVGGSGANTATAFVFVPVPSVSGKEDDVAGDAVAISVTPAGATEVQSLTPLNMSKLVGVQKLRLKSITAGDTDASSQVVVLECSLVGWR